jgi:hypothetical protein
VRSSAGPFARSDVLAIGVIAILGLLCLQVPFMGDQAVHLLGAQKLRDGGVLYRDLWDLKQPGIFWFYYAGGRLLGFTNVGIHAFELACLLGAALLIQIVTRPLFDSRRIASLASLLSVGSYYAAATRWHLTQIESIVGLPLLLTLWTSARSIRSPRRAAWLAASGIAGGLVGLLKLTYLPIVAGFWLCALASPGQMNADRRMRGALQGATVLTLGFALPLGLAAAHFLRAGLGDLLFTTFFVDPLHVLAAVPPNFGTLAEGLIWLTTTFAGLIALAVVGAFHGVSRKDSPLAAGLVLWVIIGLAMVLAQRMWWDFHYVLLIWPLGILGALGIDALWSSLGAGASSWHAPAPRCALAVALVVALAPLIGIASMKALYALEDGLLFGTQHLVRYRRRFSGHRSLVDSVPIDFLSSADSKPGDIFVFGDPTIYWLSGRSQAAAVHGWSTAGYLDEQWAWLQGDLERTLPPYVFVRSDLEPLIQDRAPGIHELLRRRYGRMEDLNTAEASSGWWYERKD